MKGFISNRENLVGLGAYSNTHSFFLFFSFFSCFSVSLSGAVFFIICSAWFRTYQCWTPVSKWLQMTAAKITTPGLKFEVEWTKEKLKNREEIHYNVSIFSFSKSYSGCCWIYLSHYAGPSSWKVQTAINFAPRSEKSTHLLWHEVHPLFDSQEVVVSRFESQLKTQMAIQWNVALRLIWSPSNSIQVFLTVNWMR